jgi:hypothetical protein
MKSLIFLVLILIIGWLTVPGSEKFSAYLQQKERADSVCTNGTSLTSYKVLSIAYVDYCEGAMQKTRTDKYLGLFGTFWKLSD